MIADVVPALATCGLERRAVTPRAPTRGTVDVARVVHLVDLARAPGPGADLAEHDLAVGLRYHSMCVKPSPCRARRAPGGRARRRRRAAAGDRHLVICGLIHSLLRAIIGLGRYRANVVLSGSPLMVTVSNVNSSPSTNSSTLASPTCCVLVNTSSSSAALAPPRCRRCPRRRSASADRIADFAGLARLARGALAPRPGRARRPAASSSFISCLSRKPRTASYEAGHAPERLAQAGGGEHHDLPVASTRSTRRPRIHWCTARRRRLVDQPRDLEVIVQVSSSRARAATRRRVPQAVDVGADLGEAARVLGISGG